MCCRYSGFCVCAIKLRARGSSVKAAETRYTIVKVKYMIIANRLSGCTHNSSTVHLSLKRLNVTDSVRSTVALFGPLEPTHLPMMLFHHGNALIVTVTPTYFLFMAPFVKVIGRTLLV